jgi:hypothetical protein
MKRRYLPAAKMLLMFPSLTATAVTGPGSPELAPTAAQLLFFKLNCATFALELFASAIEPDATKMLWSALTNKYQEIRTRWKILKRKLTPA